MTPHTHSSSPTVYHFQIVVVVPSFGDGDLCWCSLVDVIKRIALCGFGVSRISHALQGEKLAMFEYLWIGRRSLIPDIAVAKDLFNRPTTVIFKSYNSQRRNSFCELNKVRVVIAKWDIIMVVDPSLNGHRYINTLSICVITTKSNTLNW